MKRSSSVLLPQLLCIFSFCFCLAFSVHAQQQYKAGVNGFSISLYAPSAWLEMQQPEKRKQLVILRLSDHLKSSELQQWEAAHVFIQDYLGDHLYTARLDEQSNLSTLPKLQALASMDYRFKLTSSILHKSKSARSLECFVTFYPGFSSDAIKNVISKAGATIVPSRWESKGIYHIDIPAAGLPDFAQHYAVKFIGEPNHNKLLDLDSKGAHTAAQLSMPVAAGGKNLKGSGVFIGHGDNCSGIYHIDQADRTINYNTGDKTSHGVLTHGIISGDGIINPAGQGIATDAHTISFYFDDVLFAKDALQSAYNATLTNNSYAAAVGDCLYAGTYDNISVFLDSMALALPEQLDVFAAGNDGRLACGAYPAGYYNICGGFQPAKNILSVGATNRELVLGDGSSRGPVRDGRLKPEITANGIDIMCPVPDNTYTVTRGTSLSCPQVTGALALLTERYRQLFGGANPKTDLLKPLVMNSGIDLGNRGPDFWYGYGLLNTVRAVKALENAWYRKNVMAAGASPQQFSITVPANMAQLKVMLYYHDPAASPSASLQLVNDLDLTVQEPSGGPLHRPLILNSAPSGVGDIAIEGADHVNNSEQVIIDNPVAGVYNVTVSDFDIPKGPQSYTVVYDIVPREISISYPVANAAVAAGNDLYIYWDIPYDPAASPVNVEYSVNGGVSWTMISNTVPANNKVFKWAVPAINSNQCRVRISRGPLSSETGNFVIHQQAALTLSTDQCPGTIQMTWPAVPSASRYYILLKKGAHYQKIDSVAATTLSYAIRGLNPGETYYVSLLPLFGTMEGYRSNALVRKPSTGDCATFSKGDLSLEAIISPVSGRKFTSKELATKTPLQIRVRNQSDFYLGDCTIDYQLNGGAWKRSRNSFSMAALSVVTPYIDSIDLHDTIGFTLKVVVVNNDMSDPVSSNDTLVKVFRHIGNPPLSLSSPLLFDFETLPDFTLHQDTVGMDINYAWDYHTTNDSGRLRSRIPGSRLVSSSGSFSMDVNVNTKSVYNELLATFNLVNYDTGMDELRFEFDYQMRGMPLVRDSNKVWVRGSDRDTWIPVFVYSNIPDTFKLKNSGTISLRDVLRSASQNYSFSTQIRFGQYDSTVIVDDHMGGGLTIDNVRLYKILKDAQLSKILTPFGSECGISSSPVRVRIKNGSMDTLRNIRLAYTIDAGVSVSELFPGEIPGDDSTDFTFSVPLSGLRPGKHELRVWLSMPGDDYLKNDTIGNYVFNVSNVIDRFPYLQDFENSDGEWYVEGKNPSWAYGMPAGNTISMAASGVKAWKTNLNGTYNSDEQSYLVSPCLNTIELSRPMLSFSMAFDIESCEAFCDGFFLEYSVDNEKNWSRLGLADEGTNWYNNRAHMVWNGSGNRWHVASIDLPREPQLKLRFNFRSDYLKNLDGVAIDDIHIFDRDKPVVDLSGRDSLGFEAIPLNKDIWNNYQNTDGLGLSANDYGLDFGRLSAVIYRHTGITDSPSLRQYIMPRSFVIRGERHHTDSLGLRLFVTDKELNTIWSDSSCPSCTRSYDIYRTGITHFNGEDPEVVDGSFLNNKGPVLYYPYRQLQWIPYDNGYFVQFKAKGLGEFWLNDGGVLGTIPAFTNYIFLSARRIQADVAALQWYCAIDSQIRTFVLERSLDSLDFDSVASFSSAGTPLNDYFAEDKNGLSADVPVYYRLLCITRNERSFYSNVAVVDWTRSGNELVKIFPNPSSDGIYNLIWLADEGSRAEMSITDMTGRTIDRMELKSGQWYNHTQLSLAPLSKGVYFLKMKIGERIFTEKLLFR